MSIIPDFCSAVVGMVSFLPLIFNSSSFVFFQIIGEAVPTIYMYILVQSDGHTLMIDR